MGVCYSCLQGLLGRSSGGRRVGGGDGRYGNHQNKEMEMTLGNGVAGGTTATSTTKALCISKTMSAPTIVIHPNNPNQISGYGLALADVSIEQDAAYWEVHIVSARSGVGGSNEATASSSASLSSQSKYEIRFGVATRKDQTFYRTLEDHSDNGGDENDSEHDGTALMRTIPVSPGDVVGVAVQQSDLPMVQFMLNGSEPLNDIAIHRFRGTVYPALYIPASTVAAQQQDDNNNNDNVCIRLVLDEGSFQQLSPHPRFGPVIIARGIL